MGAIMNSVSKDLVDKLVDLGQGTKNLASGSGWGIYQTSEPPTPDNAITVYDGTDIPKRHQTGVSGYDESVQIRLRGRGYDAVYAKARAVEAALRGAGRFTVAGSAVYKHIGLTSGPIPLAKDENRRRIFTMNFRVQRKEA